MTSRPSNHLPQPRRRGLAASIAALLAASAIALTPAAQARVFLSVNIAPPPLPVYEQPPIPGPGYVWTPGYWAYGDGGYYWVPGTWVMAPYTGALWTPGYWGWNNGAYAFHDGYWGLHVGYYGGIDYGFGYTGSGYYGGYWNHGRLYYNSAVTRFGGVRITNVYNRTVINNTTINRVSYNGGPGGVHRAPTRTELAIAREPHFMPSVDQVRQRERASREASLRASVNHGMPPIAATQRPGVFDRGTLRAEAAAASRRDQKTAALREAAGMRTANRDQLRERTATHQQLRERTLASERTQARSDAQARVASEHERFKQRQQTIRENMQAQHRALMAEHVRTVHAADHRTAEGRAQAAADRAQFQQRREAIRETAQSQRRAAVAEHVQAMRERNREAVNERARFEARGPERSFRNRPEPREMMRNAAPARGERVFGRGEPVERPKDHRL